MRKVSRLPAILGLGLVLSADTSGKAPPDAPDPKTWIEGPVRYIAAGDEIDVFRSLDADAARTSFIEQFWRRRDPLPETSANEYRHLFWERVKEANDRF